MHSYMLSHVRDAALLSDLAALVVRDRITTANLLAHIAEVDSRRLYVAAGYPSMHGYCVDGLHFSDDAAYRRIQAARAARQFPDLLLAVAEGRLHLTGVCLLAPHLTPENVGGLIEAATHRRKVEIEEFLARRLPPSESPGRARAVPALRPVRQLAPARVQPGEVGLFDNPAPAQADPSDRGSKERLAPAQVNAAPTKPNVLQVTIERSTRG